MSDPVQRAIDAVNAGDTMREWSDRELIGARTRFDVTGSEPTADGVRSTSRATRCAR